MKRTKVSHASASKNSQSSKSRKRKPTATDTQVGKAIRAHRLIAHMSQSELGEQLGVSFQQVQKYEKGTNRVGAGRLHQIAEILSISISDLFKESASASPGGGPDSSAPVNLITDSTVLRLLNSYAEITDRTTRNCLADLVEQIAMATRKSKR